MKVLVLGSTGMLGHVVKQYFIEKGYEVFCTSRDKQSEYFFDVLDNIKKIEDIIQGISPKVIINCIGILNKVAEDNHDKAVLVNSYLPNYLDVLSQRYKFKLIHISTDCVFDGKKGEYFEDSIKDAKNFYGQSKGLGEIINDRNVTLRTSIIGPDMNVNGIGLFKWFMDQDKEVNGFSNVIWTGVTTLELAKAIEKTVNNNIVGLYHVVNNKKIDKYSLLLLFKEYFKSDIVVNREENYISDKSLISTQVDFDFKIPEYEEMIMEMKEWILEHSSLYEELIKKIK
jgi:dTDP-4-dehydrorhamnose reductase